MTAGRLRLLSVVALLLADGLALLAWSQQWFVFRIDALELEVPGSIAGGAVVSLALAGVVLVGAVALAGPVFRTVLAVLQALLGVCVVVQAALALADPVRAARSLVTETTQIAGDDSIHALVDEVSPTAWPAVALAAGVLLAALGILLAATTRRWPAATRRYDRTRLQEAGNGAAEDGTAGVDAAPEASPHSAVDDWDALSGGDDPTAAPR